MKKIKNLISKNAINRKRTLLVVLILACIFIVPTSFVCAGNPSGDAGLFDYLNPIKWVIYMVYVFVGWFFSIAATLFGWIVNPDNVSGANGILNKKAIMDVWIMVRDILNMTFILILLFSAFCTIFQIEKWGLKKVWLNILINALLVNFSFTIARFIIDISNVAFYYFINNMFASNSGSVTGYKVMADIASVSKIESVLIPNGGSFYGMEISYQLMMIVMTFILGVTMLIIAILFVIRLMALAIIIMFSPIGFVGYIFPSTSKYADEWWQNLFNYSFFAPIMIFMIAIAFQVARAIGTENASSFLANASANTVSGGPDANFIAGAAFFSIPIIILWMGMGIAKKMSIAGAETVVGTGQKFALGVMKRASGIKFAQDTYQSYKGRRDKAKGDNLSNRIGNWFGNKQDQLRGVVPDYKGDRARQRYQSEEAARVTEEAKLRDTANMTENELRNLSTTGNKYAQAAARQELANKGMANAADLNAAREAFGETSQIFKQLQSKIKTYDPVTAFNGDMNRIGDFVDSNQFDLKKINANSLGNQAFVETLFNRNAISTKDIADLSQSVPKRNAINAALGNLVATHNVAANPMDQNIHMAHFAQTGNIANGAFTGHIFQNMDKDTAKRINLGTITANGANIHQINGGKLKEIVSNINDNASRVAMIHEILSQPSSPAIDVLVNQINNDPYLSSLV